MTGNELDLMNSRIVGDPIMLIENALIPFDFVPVEDHQINDLKRMF